MALRSQVDVAIIASGDSDLVPAIHEALDHSSIKVEVVGWHNGTWGQRMKVPGRNIWCHWLDEAAFYAVQDETVY